jgi:hypothetical protein
VRASSKTYRRYIPTSVRIYLFKNGLEASNIEQLPEFAEIEITTLVRIYLVQQCLHTGLRCAMVHRSSQRTDTADSWAAASRLKIQQSDLSAFDMGAHCLECSSEIGRIHRASCASIMRVRAKHLSQLLFVSRLRSCHRRSKLRFFKRQFAHNLMMRTLNLLAH